MKIKHQNQSGAVSLFIVIFTCLLVTIITVGFINGMIRNQQQVSDTDLSKSAYDSAMAGVEDSKRLMLEHLACVERGDSSPACTAKANAISDQNCNTIQSGLGIGVVDREVMVRQSAGDDALDQAYTCVKIDFNTDNYLNEIIVGETKLVPLKSTGNFDRVKISWFKRSGGGSPMTLPTVAAPLLPQESDWQITTPPVLRTQVIQTGANFQLSDFDNMTPTESNANTVFLYPDDIGVAAPINLNSADNRSTGSAKAPVVVRCDAVSYAGGGYACEATILMLSPIGGGNRANAYLRLNSIYNSTDYKVELFDGATAVSFAGVQPEVDSTGRANELFRRVKARVEFSDSGFPYPQAAVELEGNLCKNFKVTDTTYTALTPACTP